VRCRGMGFSLNGLVLVSGGFIGTRNWLLDWWLIDG
jgi:hypothetical protein